MTRVSLTLLVSWLSQQLWEQLNQLLEPLVLAGVAGVCPPSCPLIHLLTHFLFLCGVPGGF